MRGHDRALCRRHRQLFAVLLVLYLMLDFSDGSRPGLLNFNDDPQRDAVLVKANEVLHELAVTVPAPADPHKVAIGSLERPPRPRPSAAHFLADWLSTLRLSHSPTPTSLSADSDH